MDQQKQQIHPESLSGEKLYSYNGLVGFVGTDSNFVGFSLSFVGFVVFVGFVRNGPGADLER